MPHCECCQENNSVGTQAGWQRWALSVLSDREEDTIDVAALATWSSAGVSTAAAACAAGEKIVVFVVTARTTCPDADIAAAGRVASAVKRLIHGSSVARDRVLGQAVGALQNRILVPLGVGAAGAAGRSARVAAARASCAALEVEAEIVGAANRICRPAGQTTAH